MTAQKRTKKSNLAFLIIKIAMALIFLAYLLKSIGLTNIGQALSITDYKYILISLSIFVFSLFLHSLSLWILVKSYGLTYPELLKITLKSTGYATFTPGRIGEFSVIYYFHKKGISTGVSSGIYFLIYLITLGQLFCVSLLGVFKFKMDELVLRLFIVFALITTLILAMLFVGNVRRKTNQLLPNMVRGKLTGFTSIQREFLIKKPHLVAVTGLLLLIRLMAMYYMMHLIFFSMNCQVDFSDICIINSMSRIIALIPVSFNGLGVRECVQVYLYGRFIGIDSAMVMSAAIWQNLIIYVSAFVFLMLPLSLDGNKNK